MVVIRLIRLVMVRVVPRTPTGGISWFDVIAGLLMGLQCLDVVALFWADVGCGALCFFVGQRLDSTLGIWNALDADKELIT